ncbi:hypothetical protein BKA70DRAFT_1443247 [Coprinopsis sp. MPI-PUGE-AT-0042]|nr:hypothetical protein BKA70DRAFT_1443247 [Coprinopsis sp. MPI-PUGE-AT-0042]
MLFPPSVLFQTPTGTSPLPSLSLPTSATDQCCTRSSCFVHLIKQPASAYHHGTAPPTLPSQAHTLNFILGAHDEWIINLKDLDTGLMNSSKQITCTIRSVFISIRHTTKEAV